MLYIVIRSIVFLCVLWVQLSSILFHISIPLPLSTPSNVLYAAIKRERNTDICFHCYMWHTATIVLFVSSSSLCISLCFLFNILFWLLCKIPYEMISMCSTFYFFKWLSPSGIHQIFLFSIKPLAMKLWKESIIIKSIHME